MGSKVSGLGLKVRGVSGGYAVIRCQNVGVSMKLRVFFGVSP